MEIIIFPIIFGGQTPPEYAPLIKYDVDEVLASVLLQGFAYAKAAELGELSNKEQLDKYTKLWFDTPETAEKNITAYQIKTILGSNHWK